MKEKLQAIREDAISKITASDNLDKLNQIRVEVLGKKGQLTEVLKGMKDVAPEDRPKVGQLVNDTRKIIEEKMEEVKAELQAKAREAKLKAEVIDVTLPAKKNKIGHKHPNTLALEELERIFTGMGYEVVEGPEVEYDHYNFEALNIPDNHPAKDEQDTFYINKNIVLRTQTSSVQARVMKDFNADYTVETAIKKGIGLDELNEIIEKALKSMRIHIEKLFPYTDAGKPGLIRKYGQLIKEEYREDGIWVEAYVPSELMDRL